MSVNRLKVPSFDLCWLPYDKYEVIMVPGGGGSTKSGIANQIQLIKLIKNKPKIDFIPSVISNKEESSLLCFHVNYGYCKGFPIVTAIYDKFFIVYKVNKDKDGNIIFDELVASNKLEDHDNSYSYSTITSSSHIITAEDFGNIKLWNLTQLNDDEWKIDQVYSITAHKAAIMDLSIHPLEPIVVSSSKDGSCKLWNIDNGELINEIPNARNLMKKSDPKLSIECRGSCFSIDGLHLYSIQSGKRGSTYLFDRLITIQRDNSTSKLTVDIKVLKVIEVSRVPCTKLKTNDKTSHLAIGSSDGSIVVVTTSNLKKVYSKQFHDLPVTGLGFAPIILADEEEVDCIVNSCSADYKLTTIRIGEISKLSKIIVLLFYIIVTIIFIIAMLIILLGPVISKEFVDFDED